MIQLCAGGLAFQAQAGSRLITGLSAVAGVAATVTLIFRLMHTNPGSLILLALMVAVAMFGRPLLLRHVKTMD